MIAATRKISILALVLCLFCCQYSPTDRTVIETPASLIGNFPNERIKPLFVTDLVKHDTDDPAIWINYENPTESLIIGTDKAKDGALYVFDLEGKILDDKVVRGLKRPNNVDVEYGLSLNGEKVDIAVTTERFTGKLRIFSLPEMKALDRGGVDVFEGEAGPEYRDLMGIALYKRPTDEAIFAIVGRKNGPQDGTYLWQYLLKDNGFGDVEADLVRKFGQFSGKKEIEAIAVDDELGYVYYSDEQAGIRKYYADPVKGEEELAYFATEGFAQDNEGISIYRMNDGTGYILVSDQGANKFHIFSREGTEVNPHHHELLKTVSLSTISSDGSEVMNFPLPPHFPGGLFVAMSDDKTFQFYRWEEIAGDDLKIQPF
ncbi:phytase [Catalinimonas niigatensis]|uniref:phytase n=1 Tax=Catalinimonas niigatensis TaxID=1397264 RepID=UPI002666F7DE|nr:phytase [Catalinimonas niigatensis]WPP52899.1 phytase [Catalinimonas niigatensis]